MTSIMNGGISMGAELILHPRFEINAMMASLARDKPTILHAVPTIYSAIATAAEKHRVDISSLRVCVSGGAPLPAEIRERFQKLTGCRVIEGYGLTEASPAVTSNPPDGSVRADSVGIVLQGTTLEIRSLDDINRILPPNQRGEICVRGPQVMKGYLNREQETRNTFIDGALRTGDVGYLDADGYLFITDRIKDMIISGGENVYSAEVENALAAHPAVASCAVIGVPDDEWGERVHAVVVLAAGTSTTAPELRYHVKERIAGYKAPRTVESSTSCRSRARARSSSVSSGPGTRSRSRCRETAGGPSEGRRRAGEPSTGALRRDRRRARSGLLEVERVVADPDPQALAVLGDRALLFLGELAGGAQRALRVGDPAVPEVLGAVLGGEHRGAAAGREQFGVLGPDLGDPLVHELDHTATGCGPPRSAVDVQHVRSRRRLGRVDSRGCGGNRGSPLGARRPPQSRGQTDHRWLRSG
jgi:hypothetical protein